MDDIEFEPFEDQDLKRIGPKNDADKAQDSKRPFNQNKFKPSNFKILIFVVIAVVCFFGFIWYQDNIRHPEQTKNELLDIRNALYLHKESFGTYPEQLAELAKGRPLRESWSTDAWDNPYRYDVDKSNQTFTLISAGSDGEFGTDDDLQIQ